MPGTKTRIKKSTSRLMTEWDLTELYSSPKDPQLHKDVDLAEKTYKAFNKKYSKKRSYMESDTALLRALKDYEALDDTCDPSKPLYYLYLLKTVDSTNKTIESQINILSARLTKISHSLYFFILDLGTIDKKRQKKLLADQRFKHYHYYLAKIFESSRHQLSEPEEKILSLKSMTSHSMWTQGVQKVLSQKTVRFKGKDIPLSEAGMLMTGLPKVQRRKLRRNVREKQYEVADFAEAEINAIVTNKKVNDELRGYEKSYSASVMRSDNKESIVEVLIDAIYDKKKIYQDFLDLKSEIIGEKPLQSADTWAEIGTIKKSFNYKDCVTILEEVYQGLGKDFEDILFMMTRKGRIEVNPKVGKRGGAYSHGGYNLPTVVFLNHVGNFTSLMHLSHEMGHAVHTEFSKKQPHLYQEYTLSIAEVASTLFEKLTFDHISPMLSKKDRVIALHNRVGDRLGLTYGVAGRFRFEEELHHLIRERGMLSHEEMAILHNKHFSSLAGNRVERDTLEGYGYIGVTHYRDFFYNYQYAYGELVSSALHRSLKDDPSYIDKIRVFLEAGGSKAPRDVFKSIGIDTTKKEFWYEGLEEIKKDIKQLKTLCKEEKFI